LLIGCVLAPAAALAETFLPVESDALVPAPGAMLRGLTAPATKLHISLALPSRDAAGASAFANRVSDPRDTLFRHYLTPVEYAARFGASEADYDALVAWARANGLEPGERYTARTVLPLHGTAAAFEAALGVVFHDYTDSTGRVFYAADTSPSLPAELAPKVASIIGLNNFAVPRPQLIRRSPTVARGSLGHGVGGGFDVADLRSIYEIPALSTSLAGTKFAVIDSSRSNATDVATYQKWNNLPATPVPVRSVDGFAGDNGSQAETALDIDMIEAANPLVTSIIDYVADPKSNDFFVNGFSAMATDGYAQVISVSWGEDENETPKTVVESENTVLTQLQTQGQSVFVSAGDNGAFYYDTPNTVGVSDPAAQPRVTAVGGTTVAPGSNETYGSESVWNEFIYDEGATGGGVSILWSLPSYQSGVNTTRNGGSSIMRNVPDVAAVADPETGVSIYVTVDGGWQVFGGTSAAAPFWAGMFGIADSASHSFGFGRIGFANPELYKIAKGAGNFFPNDFHDVVTGNNGAVITGKFLGFNAGPDYDNTTGLGSFIGNTMAAELALYPARANANPPGAPTNLEITPAATSLFIKWAPGKNASGYDVKVALPKGFTIVANQMTVLNSITINGLTPNTSYLVAVYAVSKGGFSRDSGSTKTLK
jgi:kumamolisin